jgi:hypothetical protein
VSISISGSTSSDAFVVIILSRADDGNIIGTSATIHKDDVLTLSSTSEATQALPPDLPPLLDAPASENAQ